VRVLGEEPGLGLPNQHTKACPRFQTMHCWCPPATGPGQPHESDCVQYKRTLQSGPKSGPFFAKLSVMQAQAYAAAISWVETHDPTPVELSKAYTEFASTSDATSDAIECTCAAMSGVIGHAAFCPLGEKL
jgi:hypothetical protein